MKLTRYFNIKSLVCFLLFLVAIYCLYFLYKTKENLENESEIPKTLYMCHKELNFIEKYSENWKKLNKDYDVKLYDNSLCKQFLEDNYSNIHVKIFDYLQDGPIKADFWRICILNKNGGVYADADIEPFIGIDKFLEPNVNLVICSTYDNKYNYNPNFLISTKENLILQNCIDWYINKFNNGDKYDYWDWSIVQAFNDTLNLDGYDKKQGIYIDGKYGKKVQILEQIEKIKGNNYEDYVIYNDVKLFNDRYKNYDTVNHVFKD